MTEEFWSRIIEAFKSADSPIESQLIRKRAFGGLCFIGLPPREALRFSFALQLVFSKPRGTA
jgi:hypothetical protein